MLKSSLFRDGDKYRNPRYHFARTRIDVLAAHASQQKHWKNKDAFLERNLELKTIIDSSNKEISDNQRAISFYTDFVERAEGHSDRFDAAVQRHGYENNFRRYVKFIRRMMFSNITREVRNANTNHSFSHLEKMTILGVCLDPDFYNEGHFRNEENVVRDMEQRLLSIGISFQDRTVENNSVQRFYSIMKDNRLEVSRFKPKGWEENKWYDLIKDMRSLCNDRISKLGSLWVDQDYVRYEKCRNFLKSENKTLGELAIVAEQIIEAQREFNFNRAYWKSVSDLSNIDNNTPWQFSSSILDFIGSKDFSLSSLGLGYATISPRTMRKIRDNFVDGNNLDESEAENIFNEHWKNYLGVILKELVHWMTRPSLGRDSEDGKASAGGQRCVYSSGAYQYKAMKQHPRVYTTQPEWGILPHHVKMKYESIISRLSVKKLSNSGR